MLSELLIESVKGNNLGALQTLLKQGVKDSRLSQNQGTALHYAAQLGYFDCVKLLVESGSSLFAKDIYGRSALVCAARCGHLAIVKYLADKMSCLPKRRFNEINLAITIAAYLVCVDLNLLLFWLQYLRLKMVSIAVMFLTFEFA